MRKSIALAVALIAVAAPGVRAQPSVSPGHPLQDSKVELSMGAKCAQHKLAFVDGRWWAALATSNGVDLYSLDPSTKTWSRGAFADAHVASDSLSRPDVIWTGSELLVLTDERVGSTTKLRLHAYRYAAPDFVQEPGLPVDVVTGTGSDTIAPNVQTVAVDSAGRAWVTYRSGNSGIVKASTGTGPAGWTSFGPAIVMADLEAGLGDTPGYMAMVTFGGDKTGVFWMDQRAGAENGFKFRWRSDAQDPGATWMPEEKVASGDNLGDDHVNVQSFEGKVYAVVKTNYDTDGMPIFEFYRRDLDGTWHQWNVLVADGSWRDNASRPILVLEPGRRLVHVFYNGGGVVMKTTSIDAPDFSAPPVQVIDAPTGIWNTQSTAQLVDGTSGLIVVCDTPASASTWQYWGEVDLGGSPPPPPPPPPGPVTTVTVTPNPASTTTSGTVQFRAVARDANGDAVSETFSWDASAGTIDPSGRYTAPVTSGTFTVSATAQGVTGSASVNVTDPPPPSAETIVDDGASGFSVVSGTWNVHFTPSRFGSTNRTLDSTQGGRCQWTASLATGTYDVFAWWPSRPTSSSARPTYTVHSTQGDVAVPVDQTVSSTWGVWNKLGTFSLDASAAVTIDGAAGTNPAADAVRFVLTSGSPPPPPPQQILTTIVVEPNPAATTPDGVVVFTAQAKDQNGQPMDATFTWTASAGTIDAAGRYTAPDVTGSFDVSASSQGIVGHATVNVAAAPAETIVDDATPGWSIVSGTWAKHFNAFRFGDTDRLPTSDTAECQWKPTLASGTYDVYVWVPARTAPALATYSIATTSGVQSVSVDQSQSAVWGVWTKLGTFALDGATASVHLVAASGQNVAADAVRFVRIAP